MALYKAVWVRDCGDTPDGKCHSCGEIVTRPKGSSMIIQTGMNKIYDNLRIVCGICATKAKDLVSLNPEKYIGLIPVAATTVVDTLSFKSVREIHVLLKLPSSDDMKSNLKDIDIKVLMGTRPRSIIDIYKKIGVRINGSASIEEQKRSLYTHLTGKEPI